jgi:plastocyanin
VSLARRAVALTALAGAVTAAAVSCVSDRTPTTETEVVDCQIRVSAARSVLAARSADSVAVVAIKDFAFIPDTVRIGAGASVVWVNCEDDGTPHTSTSDGDAWASTLLSPGQSFGRRFDSAGNFPYHCEPHPFMTGTVVVE